MALWEEELSDVGGGRKLTRSTARGLPEDGVVVQGIAESKQR